MHSATENARVVQEYLDKEVTLGRVVGPISPKAVPVGTQLSPMGVLPKSSQPGKWRLIVDLSSPEGRSVNGGNRAGPLLAPIPAVRRGNTTDSRDRPGDTPGEDGYRERLPYNPSTPGGPAAAWNAMGRGDFLRHQAPVWPEISSQNFLSRGGCSAVVHSQERGELSGSLPR